jgi:hypothetical protein
MRKVLLIAGFGITAVAAAARAGDAVSESEMFSSPDVVTQSASLPSSAEEKNALGFSGELVSVIEDISYSTTSVRTLNSYMLGNLMLDARLKNGVKAFANMEAAYHTNPRDTTSALREAFLDFNLDRRVYFRAGKQVLQWGRCALWNPTDLINVEKKTFLPKIGYRDGAYGLKVHVPFGAAYNIYGFLDTGTASEDRDLGGALKFEFLAGRTEMAFSGWAKRARRPVFGYDMSSRLGEVDITGEWSLARRDNSLFVRDDGGTLDIYRKKDNWVNKAAVNFSKGFRLGNFNDRLTAAAEFFYNQNGYVKTPFRDGAAYNLSIPLASMGPAGTLVYQNTGTKKDFMLANGLYTPNYLARYYGAVFTGISRFIITDMSLNTNYIRNLNDGTGVLSAGVSYKNINDFSAGFLASSFLGPSDGEYTFPKAKLLLQLTAGVSF